MSDPDAGHPTRARHRSFQTQDPSIIIMQQSVEETAERLKHQAKTEASRLIDEAVTGELSGGGGTDSSLSQRRCGRAIVTLTLFRCFLPTKKPGQ